MTTSVDAVVRPTHPMKHADFVFGLTYPKSNAHTWADRPEAEAFAAGIRESAVETYYGRHGLVWVVRVGPWMYASQVRPNAPADLPATAGMVRRDVGFSHQGRKRKR